MLDRLLRLFGTAAGGGTPDAASILIWLILTLVLMGPAYFLLKRFGLGSDYSERADSKGNGDALDRLVTGTEEIPDAVPAGHRGRR
jgi:hypothetical protein